MPVASSYRMNVLQNDVGNVGFLIHTGLKRLRQLLPADLMEGT